MARNTARSESEEVRRTRTQTLTRLAITADHKKCRCLSALEITIHVLHNQEKNDAEMKSFWQVRADLV